MTIRTPEVPPLRKRRNAPARAVKLRRSRVASARAIESALAGIAHDIRTPLTGIVALAELLASSNLGKREREWANSIKSAADHLAALTTVIVDAAKVRAAGIVLRNGPFSIRKLSQAVAGELTARAGSKGLEAEIEIAADLPPVVSGDLVRLRAALENLIDNAVKFTEAGTVTFIAGVELIEDSTWLRVVFTVADSGFGLTPDEQKALFQPFTQASDDIARRYGGAGLGLSLVKRIAKAMGGNLEVQSREGVGSTFRLTALVSRAEGEPAEETGGTLSAPARSLALLCAEDNPYGRVVMNTILSELGHRVDFVDSGEAAVMAAERGGYDAVLMDLALAGLDGIAATRAIRALPGAFGQVPVIGTSGRNESRDETAARSAGMNFYFAKAVSPSKLAEALTTICQPKTD
jgi:CheY-like chemotaxis protein/nitrogen-specific signal transduction histidine kinase